MVDSSANVSLVGGSGDNSLSTTAESDVSVMAAAAAASEEDEEAEEKTLRSEVVARVNRHVKDVS